jgi:electron transport complex protein RnfE
MARGETLTVDSGVCREVADNPCLEKWKVKKDGGVFDQFTGATITPRAVVKATRKFLDYVRTHREQLFALVRPEVRIPVFVMVIACVVTAVELAMHAFLPGLYTVLGIFIPLIVTNCCVIGRAEAFAFKNGVAKSAVDGMATGLGFTLALVLLGALREILGQGTLFGQAELLFGEAGRGLTLHVLDDYRGFLLAILPPGAFIGLGCLIAIKNVLDTHAKRRAAAKPAVALQEVQA